MAGNSASIYMVRTTYIYMALDSISSFPLNWGWSNHQSVFISPFSNRNRISLHHVQWILRRLFFTWLFQHDNTVRACRLLVCIGAFLALKWKHSVGPGESCIQQTRAKPRCPYSSISGMNEWSAGLWYSAPPSGYIVNIHIRNDINTWLPVITID